MRRTLTAAVAAAALLVTTSSLVAAAPGAARTDPPGAARTVEAPVTSVAVRRPHAHRRTKAIMPVHRSRTLAPATSTAPMSYHGGRLMTDPAHVYLIWFGTWTSSPAPTVIGDLLDGFGGSAYARTNATFTDGAGRHVTSDVSLAGSISVAARRGARLSDAGVRRQVATAISQGKLPSDPDGIYVVMSSADVKETSGFGTRYCGWHTRTKVAGTDIRYVFVGDPTVQAPRTCAPPVASTPNADRGADAMASTLVHEIDETLTDPDLDGWYDRYYNENGDKCAWTYGATYPSANGAPANVDFSGRDFLVQRNWVVSPRQGCSLG